MKKLDNEKAKADRKLAQSLIVIMHHGTEEERRLAREILRVL